MDFDQVLKEMEKYQRQHEAAVREFFSKSREERIDREPYTLPKDDWGDGPWSTEPDKLEWIDDSTGYACLVVRSDISGSLCGYVGLPSTHPWYGVNNNRIPWKLIAVHGGLTYSALDAGIIWSTAGEDLWWLGFDTGHANDFTPKVRATLRNVYARTGEVPPLDGPPSGFVDDRTELPNHWELYLDTYKTLAYVQAEVRRLAVQVKRGENRYWRIHRAKRREKLFGRGATKAQIKERFRLNGRRSRFVYGRR